MPRIKSTTTYTPRVKPTTQYSTPRGCLPLTCDTILFTCDTIELTCDQTEYNCTGAITSYTRPRKEALITFADTSQYLFADGEQANLAGGEKTNIIQTKYT